MLNETETAMIFQYNLISQRFTKYAGIILYLLCLFATLMNILTFLRRTFYSRPCSLYLWFASVFDFAYLNVGPLTNILQHGFDYDCAISSVLFCKIKQYIVFVFAVTAGTLTTIASIDRYLASSRNSTRWKFCTRPVAIRCIQFTILFWSIVSIPLVFCYTRYNRSTSNEQLICSNPSRSLSCLIIQIVYVCIFNGFLHPVAIMIFGFLTCVNVQHLRERSLSRSTEVQNISDQMTSMLVLQLIKSSFTSLPFSIFNCYLLITRNFAKSSLYQARENLAYQIVYLLFWSNYTSFFVYVYSSTIFRKQWMKSIKSIAYYVCHVKKSHRCYQPELKRLTADQIIP